MIMGHLQAKQNYLLFVGLITANSPHFKKYNKKKLCKFLPSGSHRECRLLTGKLNGGTKKHFLGEI